jgi:site-specific recombinase XerD
VLPDGARQPGIGPCPGLIFSAPEGGPIDDGNFRDRIWNPAVEKACIRRFPPRIMRHTAASWLVQDGVPLYDVHALLGHESYATTEKYAHLKPRQGNRLVGATHRRRSPEPDASVTHETRKDLSR